MGSKPKQQAYLKPSATEGAQTRIAADQMRRFQETYQPLIERERDAAAQERLAPTYKGIAQADTMQALTGGPMNLSLSQGLGQSANLAMGAIGQQLQASSAAVNASTKRQADILAVGKGQQFDAGDALAQASRQQASLGLTKAMADQEVRLAKSRMLGQVGGVVMKQGFRNLGETNNFFKSRQYRYNTGQKRIQSRDVAFGGIFDGEDDNWW